MTAHTPGPWTHDENVAPWWGGAQPGCMVRFWQEEDNGQRIGHPIANCLRQSVGDSQAEANARLIAAAPDLLINLNRLAKWIAIHVSPENTEAMIYLDEAQAAIAKATGKGAS